MSEFRVVPQALDTYSGVLSSGGSAVDLDSAFGVTALRYVETYVPVESPRSDLFKAIYDANEPVLRHLESAMPQIQRLYAQSAQALEASARTYRTTDTDVSRTLDGKWPGGLGPMPPLSDPASSGAGLVDPRPLLAGEPESDAPIPDPVQWIMDKAGWLSISGDVLKLAYLFGLEPLKNLNQAVLGDYDDLAQAGNALRGLAEFENQAAATMSTGLATMLQDWQGRAATAAATYFTSFATALTTHAADLSQLADKYALLVQTCAQINELISGLLTDAIDWLLILAADIASAGCLASVPGINVIIALVGAYAVWKTREAVMKFIEITTRVTQAVSGLLGLTTFIAGKFADGDISSTFPSAAYVNGAQG